MAADGLRATAMESDDRRRERTEALEAEERSERTEDLRFHVAALRSALMGDARRGECPVDAESGAAAEGDAPVEGVVATGGGAGRAGDAQSTPTVVRERRGAAGTRGLEAEAESLEAVAAEEGLAAAADAAAAGEAAEAEESAPAASGAAAAGGAGGEGGGEACGGLAAAWRAEGPVGPRPLGVGAGRAGAPGVPASDERGAASLSRSG